MGAAAARGEGSGGRSRNTERGEGWGAVSGEVECSGGTVRGQKG